MVTEEDVGKYERFFRDPRVGDHALTPPASGVACSNIRTALRMLGYDNDYGDSYDDEIARLVLRFQTEQGHTSRDGAFGDSGLEMILAPYQMIDATRPDFVDDLRWAIENVR